MVMRRRAEDKPQIEKLLKIYDNLFDPINEKDYGRYWLVSNGKSEPLADSSALLKYVEKRVPEGSFINRYANLENDLILENCIYIDVDLSDKYYLMQEESNTLKTLEELSDKSIDDIDDTDLKNVKKKYEEAYDIDNGFNQGYYTFINSLFKMEAKKLKKEVSKKESEEIKQLKSDKDIGKYFIDKFERGYLKEPFRQVIKISETFEDRNIKTVINCSGSKGFALRIPITKITFEDTELKDNPENVKIFLKTLAELIETKVLREPKGNSCLDYSIYCKGMQRIPCSQHNKTKLYANFIESSYDYLEAIDVMENNFPPYIPDTIDTEENTKTFIESDIYKATIEKAVEDSTIKNYDHETGNIVYNFSSDKHEDLKKMILEIYPDSKNFFPYKVMHLLKRSGFSKEEVEAIFHDVEPDEHKYNSYFKRNIKYTFENPNAKISGLRNLIMWIREEFPNGERNHVIDFFESNFNYCGELTKKNINDEFFYDGENYPICLMKTKKGDYYIIEDFTKKGVDFEFHKSKHFIMIRIEGEPIAKLRLKKTIGAIESLDKNLKKFENKLKDNSVILDVDEILQELDILFTDSEEINNVEKEIEEENEKTPIEILEDNPRDIGALMEFSKDYLEPVARISVAYNPNKKKNEHYIYNGVYYEKLNEAILHKFIEVRFGLRLPSDSVKTLLTSIPSNNTFHYDYFQFNNNIFFNGVTGEFEKKETGFLTNKKVGMNVNGKYKLINRLTEDELNKDYEENGYSDLEKLVWEIMSVPDDDGKTIYKDSLERYEGFLEWLGYIFRPVNVNKKIINLEGLGDDGKSTLIDIFIKVVPEYSVVILPSELDKDFTEGMVANTHIIVFDEASTEEINKHENFIKNASNGRSNRSSRQMYTEESIDNLKFGLMFILSNKFIGFNTSDEALMERDDPVHMFRRFKEEPNAKKGELQVKNIDPILDNDFRGFERIVNLGIIQYNKIRDNRKFSLSTTIKQTQEILIGNDVIKNFLAINTRYDETGFTTNEELTVAFINWCNNKEIDLRKHFNYKNENSLKRYIKREMGKKIKEHYRDKPENKLITTNNNRKKVYSILLLNNEQITDRDNTKYSINEDEYYVSGSNGLTGNERIIYDEIHNSGTASINDLKKKLNMSDVTIIEIATKLVEWNYIEKS